MRLISKTAIAMLPALLAVSLATTPPPASAASLHADPAPAVATACPHTWGPDLNGNNPNAVTWNTYWVDNDQGCWQRSAIHCEAAFGVNWWAHSRWTTTEGVLGDNSCPKADKMIDFGWDVGHQAGSPYTYYSTGATAHTTGWHDPCTGWQTGALRCDNRTVLTGQRSGPVLGRCSNNPNRTCNQCNPGTLYRWEWDNTDWKWAVEMTQDDAVPCQVQAALKCQDNVTGAYVWEKGGWQQNIGVDSGVNCDSGTHAIIGNLNWQDVGSSYYCYVTEHDFTKHVVSRHQVALAA